MITLEKMLIKLKTKKIGDYVIATVILKTESCFLWMENHTIPLNGALMDLVHTELSETMKNMLVFWLDVITKLCYAKEVPINHYLVFGRFLCQHAVEDELFAPLDNALDAVFASFGWF